ncbi:Putative uncharacterized protein [Escherichia coli D6-117.29]|nr:Protein of unknown function [Escherichia coli]CDP77710.1 Putative uncharacterized protein [Escherichia coli D6-117.29]CDU38251.1 Protein of unknown function [Escherichia coli]
MGTKDNKDFQANLMD